MYTAAKYYQLEDLDPDLVDQVEEELQRPVVLPAVNVRTGKRVRAGSRAVALNRPIVKTQVARKEGWNYLQRVVLLHLESVAKMINGTTPTPRPLSPLPLPFPLPPSPFPLPPSPSPFPFSLLSLILFFFHLLFFLCEIRSAEHV